MKLFGKFVSAFVLALTLVWTGLAHADNPVVHGLMLPRGSKKVAEARYLSPYDFRHTVKFFRKLFTRQGKWAGKRFRQVMNIPAAKVVHISNSIKKDAWDGVNIIQHSGNTYIFVLKRKTYPDPGNVTPLKEGRAKEEAKRD